MDGCSKVAQVQVVGKRRHAKHALIIPLDLRTISSHIFNFICAEWRPQQPKDTVCLGACQPTIILRLRTRGEMQVRVSSYLGIPATNGMDVNAPGQPAVEETVAVYRLLHEHYSS